VNVAYVEALVLSGKSSLDDLHARGVIGADAKLNSHERASASLVGSGHS